MNEREKNPWQRKSRRLAYENPWIQLYHDDVVRPDGEPGIYGVVHFRHRAIGVVPLDTERDAILLVGQFRYTLDRYSWEIPEGGGRFDESPEEAARRELVEETGYSGGIWRELCRCELSNSVTDETAVMFVATDLVAGTATPEGTEQIETRWVPFDEALAMIARGEILDAMTIIPIQQLALERGPSKSPAPRASQSK
ncbi:MAG: NUDIX domain-containing protein [Candidatus Limnocylindrales bacterium]